MQGYGDKVAVDIAVMARRYQEWMDGVDHGDQLKMQYGLAKKFITFKPWMKLFVGLYDIMLTNSYILYCQKACEEGRGQQKLSHYDFLWGVVDGMLSIYQ
jgi:hypothetical protein